MKLVSRCIFLLYVAYLSSLLGMQDRSFLTQEEWNQKKADWFSIHSSSNEEESWEFEGKCINIFASSSQADLLLLLLQQKKEAIFITFNIKSRNITQKNMGRACLNAATIAFDQDWLFYKYQKEGGGLLHLIDGRFLNFNNGFSGVSALDINAKSERVAFIRNHKEYEIKAPGGMTLNFMPISSPFFIKLSSDGRYLVVASKQVPLFNSAGKNNEIIIYDTYDSLNIQKVEKSAVSTPFFIRHNNALVCHTNYGLELGDQHYLTQGPVRLVKYNHPWLVYLQDGIEKDTITLYNCEANLFIEKALIKQGAERLDVSCTGIIFLTFPKIAKKKSKFSLEALQLTAVTLYNSLDSNQTDMNTAPPHVENVKEEADIAYDSPFDTDKFFS